MSLIPLSWRISSVTLRMEGKLNAGNALGELYRLENKVKETENPGIIDIWRNSDQITSITCH